MSVQTFQEAQIPGDQAIEHRLRSHELENVPARKASAGDWSFHFSPLGGRRSQVTARPALAGEAA